MNTQKFFKLVLALMFTFSLLGIPEVATAQEPNPFLQAHPSNDRVVFEDWPLGVSVTLQIDDPSTPENPDFSTTATVTGPDWDPNRSWFALDFQAKYDLKTGDIVTGSDGVTAKQVTVTNLTIGNVDLDTEIVTGTAEPGSSIDVFTDDAQVHRRLIADSTGEWSADFSVPGDESWEAGLSDIAPGDHVMVFQEDEDKDRTVCNWYVPNITISAFPAEDYINGHNWPVGVPLQIEIDDPTTPVNPDYTGQATNWDPNVNSFQMIDFHGQYDMKPGDTVTVTNGTITKIHIVTELVITEIDVNTDIVSGLAEPGSEIDSWICDQYSCAERWVTVDQDGNWSANFSILDNSTVGYGTYDFTPGTGVEASQADEDGDKTVDAMDVPFDADGDGITDDIDACPNENASGYDADENGCIDTAQGLRLLLQNMPTDEVASNIKTPLLAKVNNAIKSLAKGNVNAAIHQLEAFIHQVEAQRGKKISQNTADLLIAYAQNVIAGIP